MSRVTPVNDRAIVTAVVRLLLEQTELIAFQYDSGFTVHFQRPLPDRSGLPIQVSLVLRAKWWFGEYDEIPTDMKAKNSGILKCNPDQPYKAFKLMSSVGHNVDQVDLGFDSSLRLQLSNSEILTVAGREVEWDFSWYLFVRSDTPGVDSWSINCDSAGNLEAVWPADAPVPVKAD
jgi:hypothetical protein